jgi:hypothetical protein
MEYGRAEIAAWPQRTSSYLIVLLTLRSNQVRDLRTAIKVETTNGFLQGTIGMGDPLVLA